MSSPPLPPSSSSPAHGIVLLAHGARDARWAAPFEAVAQRIRAGRPELAVQLAYLEFMTPDLLQAAQALVRQGCRHVTVAPLFLGGGGHVRRDVPQLMDALRLQHPGISWTLMPAIGEIDSVTQAMAAAVLEASGTAP